MKIPFMAGMPPRSISDLARCSLILRFYRLAELAAEQGIHAWNVCNEPETARALGSAAGYCFRAHELEYERHGCKWPFEVRR